MAASEFCQEVQGVRSACPDEGDRMAQMGTFPRGLLTHEGRDFRPIAMRPDEC